MKIVIDDDVVRNTVSVKITGQSADLSFMDALIGSLSRIRQSGNGKKDNSAQMKIEPEPVANKKRRKE